MRLCISLIAAALGILAMAQTAPEATKARQFLQLAMGRRPIVNVRAIISQRFQESNVMQQVKVEMSRDGKLHQTVLSPLSMQGFECVDDGEQMMTFSPDDRSIIVQASNAAKASDVKYRMALVDRNYTLKIERRDRVAGRAALVIAATPRNAGLETRCYTIDEKTGFLLRLETCKGEDKTMHFDTKLVEYPHDIPDEAFEMHASGTRKQVYDTWQQCPSVKNVALNNQLGFAPIVPKMLPFGFAIQEVQSDTRSKLPSVAVRLTDGLAIATVYQWQKRGPRSNKVPDGTRVADAGYVRVLIAGDVPEDIKQRLLESFIKAAAKNGIIAQPGIPMSNSEFEVLELGGVALMFSFDKNDENQQVVILRFLAHA